jgi:hypothetical protein
MSTQVHQMPTRAAAAAKSSRSVVNLFDADTPPSSQEDGMQAHVERRSRRHRVREQQQQQQQQVARLPATATTAVVSLVDDDDDQDGSAMVYKQRAKKRMKQSPNHTNGNANDQVQHQLPPRAALSPNRTRAHRKKDPSGSAVARMPKASPGSAVARMPKRTKPESDDDDDEEEAAAQVVGVVNAPPTSNLKQGDDDDDDDGEVQVVEEPASHRRRRKRRQQQHEKQLQQQQTPVEPWLQVLEFFPDVQINHVHTLLQQYKNHVTSVLCLLAEQDYPKADNRQVLAQQLPDATTTTVTMERPDDTKPAATKTKTPSLDFYSATSFTPSAQYKTEVVQCILTAFPFLTNAGAKAHLRSTAWHYAICHKQIQQTLVGAGVKKGGKQVDAAEEEEQQYVCLKNALAGQELDRQQKSRLQLKCSQPVTRRTTLTATNGTILVITDPTLQEEVDFVDRTWNDWKHKIETRLSLQKIREVCKQNGTAVSCSCCFDEFALEEMIACREEGHLFCTDCVVSYAENQIFGVGNFGINRRTKKPAMELLCMHGDGCSSGFPLAELRKALSEKVLAKYDELQFQKAMDCANMDDLWYDSTNLACIYLFDLKSCVSLMAFSVGDCVGFSCLYLFI